MGGSQWGQRPDLWGWEVCQGQLPEEEPGDLGVREGGWEGILVEDKACAKAPWCGKGEVRPMWLEQGCKWRRAGVRVLIKRWALDMRAVGQTELRSPHNAAGRRTLSQTLIKAGPGPQLLGPVPARIGICLTGLEFQDRDLWEEGLA